MLLSPDTTQVAAKNHLPKVPVLELVTAVEMVSSLLVFVEWGFRGLSPHLQGIVPPSSASYHLIFLGTDLNKVALVVAVLIPCLICWRLHDL